MWTCFVYALAVVTSRDGEIWLSCQGGFCLKRVRPESGFKMSPAGFKGIFVFQMTPPPQPPQQPHVHRRGPHTNIFSTDKGGTRGGEATPIAFVVSAPRSVDAGWSQPKIAAHFQIRICRCAKRAGRGGNRIRLNWTTHIRLKDSYKTDECDAAGVG